MKERENLTPLMARAWELFRRTQDAGHGVVVHPSVPVLFFGDSASYFESPLKVITVGLNPSKIEFDGPDPFHRFPRARSIDAGDQDRYVAALGAYFETDPYRNWFSCYEPLLQGLGVSYYAGNSNVALHTDICSPVATDPTWNNLGPAIKRALWQDGSELWHDLVLALRPDIIVMSVAKTYATGISFPRGPRRVAFTIERVHRYVVTAEDLTLGDSARAMLISGRAAQKPFGTVSDIDKRRIGEAVKELIDA